MVKSTQQAWSQPSGETTSELISAMVDGELGRQESMAFLARMKSSPEWREDWAAYHLIGDAIRQLPPLSENFEQRLAQRLAAEPTILSPRRGTVIKRPLVALSAAASVVAITLGAWQSTDPSPRLNDPVRMADSRIVPGRALSTVSLPEAQRRRNVSEYLIVHQEYSPSIAMQGVAPYVRTVYETQQGDYGR